MRRTVSAIAVILLTAACSATGRPLPAAKSTPSSASASPSATGIATPSTAGLTEDSTCADYLRANDTSRSSFLTREVEVHDPQTGNPSITLPSGPSWKGGSYNGNTYMTTGMAAFVGLALDHDCPRKETTKLGDAMAWAWTSSPTP